MGKSQTHGRAPGNSSRSVPKRTGHPLQPQWTGTDSLRERFDAILPFLDRPSVLDVGCASRYGRPDWMHGLIAREKPDVVGIDINEEQIGKLQAAGYSVQLADARDFDLDRRFDVVFAGELIEHLDDVRGFLRSVRRHLTPGGRLVLTTPNAFYFGNFVYRVGGRARVHPEHTCWYCEDTLRRVLTSNGFSRADVHYIGHSSLTPVRRAVTFAARRVLPPHVAFDTMVAVATTDTHSEV